MHLGQKLSEFRWLKDENFLSKVLSGFEDKFVDLELVMRRQSEHQNLVLLGQKIRRKAAEISCRC